MQIDDLIVVRMYWNSLLLTALVHVAIVIFTAMRHQSQGFEPRFSEVLMYDVRFSKVAQHVQ